MSNNMDSEYITISDPLTLAELFLRTRPSEESSVGKRMWLNVELPIHSLPIKVLKSDLEAQRLHNKMAQSVRSDQQPGCTKPMDKSSSIVSSSENSCYNTKAMKRNALKTSVPTKQSITKLKLKAQHKAGQALEVSKEKLHTKSKKKKMRELSLKEQGVSNAQSVSNDWALSITKQMHEPNSVASSSENRNCYNTRATKRNALKTSVPSKQITALRLKETSSSTINCSVSNAASTKDSAAPSKIRTKLHQLLSGGNICNFYTQVDYLERKYKRLEELKELTE